VELFEEAVQIDPQFASAYAALGNAYGAYVLRDPERSRAYYEQALALLDEVGQRERYFIQASFQSHFGEPEEAIYSFRKYLDRFPDDAAAHYNLGGIYRDLGDCDQATGEYRTVLELDPENAGALINIATCIANQDPETAVAHYQRAFQIRPAWETSGNLNHEYGLTLLTIGDERGARETFAKRFDAADPAERGAAQRSLGQLSIYLGRFDEAAEHFESAALLHQNVPESAGRDLLFWALGEIARGQPARAIELLGRARELIPMTSGWIWMHSIVGLTYLAAGDVESARQISAGLDSWASQNDESGIDALRRREILAASVMAAVGDIEQALDTLKEIQEIEQADNAFLSWALADVAFEGRDWAQAEASLEDLIDLRWVAYETLVPWVEAHYKLGSALDQLGRPQEAEAQYRRFLEIWGGTDSPVAEVTLARQRLERQSP
jgi:tetratricopeptide (TPR) repeat protein